MREYEKSDLLTADEIYVAICQMFKNTGCLDHVTRVDLLDGLFSRHDISWGGGSYEHTLDWCLIKLYQKSGAGCLDNFSCFIEIELTFL
jgi:hypothetical protein